MRIIKIELRNINSLKSDSPIVIDFESEQFQNVGLYAITGSTGAGKSTILDAITIALYQEVPRFRRSNVKAGLEDVVSYGESEAFSIVTFEEGEVRYEAFWGIRSKTKGGKALAKPKQEVRLKNLTEGTIIADKKMGVSSAINDIIKLSYDQFLRSAMLAQGEFASFLSANNRDKGALLEQITGEDIYKRIGEITLSRRYKEREILDKKKATINSEDLLSDETREQVTSRLKALTEQEKLLKEELLLVDKTLQWHKDRELLEQEQIELTNMDKTLSEDLEREKEEMKLLASHIEADRYRVKLSELESLKRQIKDNQEKRVKVVESISNINKTIEQQQISLKSSEKDKAVADKLYKEIIPILDSVTKIDQEILSSKKAATDILEKGTALRGEITKLNTEILALNKQQQNHSKTVEKEQIFIKSEPHITDIQSNLKDWNALLIQRNELTISIKRVSDEIKALDKEIVTLKSGIESISKSIEQQGAKQTISNKELEKLSLEIIELNSSEYCGDDSSLTDDNTILNRFKADSDRYIEQKVQLEIQEKAIIEDKKEIEILSKQIDTITPKVEQQEQSVKDGQLILEQQKQIVNLSSLRAKIEAGKPCALCGSKDHPMIKEYGQIKISEQEQIVEKRAEDLKILKNQLQEIKIKLAGALSTEKQRSTSYNQLEDSLLKLTQNSDKLKLPFKLSDSAEIGEKLELVKGKLVKLESCKAKREKLTLSIDKLKDQLSADDQKLAISKEKLTIFTQQQLEKREELKNSSENLSNIEQNIESSLQKVQLLTPKIEESQQFIKQLEGRVAKYESSKELLNSLTLALTKIQGDLVSSDRELKTKESDRKDLLSQYSKRDLEIKELNQKRSALLPLDQSVTEKRGQVQTQLDLKTKLYDSDVDRYQATKTELAKSTTLISTIDQNIAEAVESNRTLEENLSEQLKLSSFKDREQLVKAILTEERYDALSATSKSLEDRSVKLATLKSGLQTKLEKHQKIDIKLTAKEVVIKRESELTEQHKALHVETGELNKQLEIDNTIRERNRSVCEQIAVQQSVVDGWSSLLDSLGGSKDAFNTYVQRLTLSNLIKFANLHLFKLNKRYSLKLDEQYSAGEELNFKLVDHFQTDQSRSVDTASGGEKFIISLALALGLSDLSSKNVSIDSLFIDEGFGTLDNNSLGMVISALETLQRGGKMIGIISHVENLKERITTQIQIIKSSNGVSNINIV